MNLLPRALGTQKAKLLQAFENAGRNIEIISNASFSNVIMSKMLRNNPMVPDMT